jgi:two-component system, LytTR family, sensor kinase
LYAAKKWLLFSVAILMLLAATIIIKPFDSIVHFSRKDNSPQEMLIKQGDKPFDGPGRYPFRKSGRRKGPFGPAFDIVSVFLLGMVLLVVIADAAVKKANFTEQRALQAEAERIKAELSFLKAQINPHFLFNTLNNIYSLAVTKSEHTADAVMKLSNIMRYVTDGANETWAPLQDEKECIADYISLQKLRLGQNFPVEFLVSGDIDRKTIPPLSLMTFVENAFKHGISNHEQNSITFKILAQDKYIHFSATNKLFLTERNTERTGIGIENTKKRLQVLYPEKHVLNIDAKDGFYTVDLILYS